MNITIRSITKKLTSTNKEMFTVVDSGGNSYSAWPDQMGDVFPTLSPGTVIDAEIKVNGKYSNITGWKKVGVEPPPLPTAPGNTTTSPAVAVKVAAPVNDPRQESIERQVCLKAGVEFIVGVKGGAGTLEEVAEAANFFEKWLKGERK